MLVCLQMKGELMFNDVMCVYCQGVFPECDEYDGIMPLKQAIEYLGLDINDYL